MSRFEDALRNEREAHRALCLASKRIDACEWMRDHAIERVDGLSHLNAIGRAHDLLDAEVDVWREALRKVVEAR